VVDRVVEQRKAAARNPQARRAELEARWRPTPATACDEQHFGPPWPDSAPRRAAISPRRRKLTTQTPDPARSGSPGRVGANAMTSRHPKPCLGNGRRPCPTRGLATVGSRCQRCRSEYNISLGSSTQRGYGGAWRSLREEILERDRFICHWCGGSATSVDHVMLKSRGGGDHPDNLVAACGRCNSARNQNSKPSKQARLPANPSGGPANPPTTQQIECTYDD
jgi:5-methylcytosine-specific restriction endonuclease McrA